MDFIAKYLDPTLDPQWDEIVASFPDANIFHTSSWAQTLKTSYRYQPLYAVFSKNGEPVCLVPLMEVNSILTGKRGVSLPFTDWCPIITSKSVSQSDVIDELLDFGRSREWKTLELRDSEQPIIDDHDSLTYLVHELDLEPGEKNLFNRFRDSTKRNIRKAVKLGVTVVENNSWDGLKDFSRLNVITRRDHGLPPQPPVFFENLYRNIIYPGSGRILLARYEGATIAAAIYLFFNGRALYKYGASDRTMQHLRGNNLLMCEAIKRFAQEGNKSFHFGRTNSDQEGLLQFKRGWGALERNLQYQKFSLPDGRPLSSSIPVFGFHNRVFSRLPLTTLGLIGRILYRHVG